ncbi:MAG: glycosyltransferase family 4 protein [Vicinamibacterales bacterium]
MTSGGPRLLLLLPQLAQDPASGAARSMTDIASLLARSGWQVRALTTTVSEAGQPPDPSALLAAHGIDVERRSKRGPELHYTHRGIRTRALLTGRHLRLDTWERVDGRRFDLAFGEELDTFQPDVVFTYGMHPGDLRRQQTAARRGMSVVFGLRNEAYLGARTWDHLAGVLTPSEYLTSVYRNAFGLASTPLFAPLDTADVLATTHDPIFITMVNPSARKGVDFFARLAHRLSAARPDLPFLVIESEGRAGTLLAAGDRAGIDLRRHENIRVSPPVPGPRDIFAPTRILIVPSLAEPGARVVGEALINGVPPVVSDRGGLPEMCGGAGRVLPLVDDSSLDAWCTTLITLMDDDELYGAERAKALEAATAFSPDVLRPRYDAYFRALLP